MYKRLLAAFGIILALHTPTAATHSVVITRDMGGMVSDYNQRWNQYHASGARVVIAGACASACARFMTLERVCATEQGYFYLHGLRDDNDEIDRPGGIKDSEIWETPKSLALDYKYDVFGYGLVKSQHKPASVHVEPGVDIVYLHNKGDRWWKLLRVKATVLVPACKR